VGLFPIQTVPSLSEQGLSVVFPLPLSNGSGEGSVLARQAKTKDVRLALEWFAKIWSLALRPRHNHSLLRSCTAPPSYVRSLCFNLVFFLFNDMIVLGIHASSMLEGCMRNLIFLIYWDDRTRRNAI
jgi:hypothetical protein